jgi:hypothetical protein
MAGGNLDAYKVKGRQLVWAGVFLVASLMALRGLMFGQSMNMKLLVSTAVAVAVVLGMDKHYWLLCPFFFVTEFSIPGLPFNGREIGCISLIAIFFVRKAVAKDSSALFNKGVLLSIPFFLWICFIWVLNPVGMTVLGSSTIGGRFYFLLALGVASLFVLANIGLKEKDCKRLFYVLIIGYLLNMLFGTAEVLSSDFGSLVAGKTHYNFMVVSYIVVLLLCRYHLTGLIMPSWRFIAAFIACGLTAYSGHRTSMGRVVVAPLLFAIITKKQRLATIIMYAFVAIVVLFVIAGHGTLYELPFSIQRSLSFLPGDWDARLDDYGFRDVFREEMQTLAREAIKTSPWTGTRGFAIDFEQVVWATHGGSSRSLYAGHEVSKNWHNVWYGMAADFGIPASILWCLFWFFSFVWGLKGLSKLDYGSWAHSCYTFFFIIIIYSFIKSFTDGGHSAKTPYESFVWFGFMLAIENGAKQRTKTRLNISNG